VPARDVELGFLALPEAAPGPAPGVVLVHDVWGLGEHARDLCRRLAAEGFAVLGIDLYRDLGEVKVEDPGRWMRQLSDPGVLADIAAGAAFLSADPAMRAPRVGVVGFCMGGMYALMAACGTPGVAAAVPFYGLLSHGHGLLHDPGGLDPARKPRQPLDAARDLRCPLLAFFGAEDAFIPLADVEELERRLAGASAPHELVVVPGAGHAFMNDTRPEAYREDAAREAWRRMVSFLREHLA
jgi:carboxymethylenebutenolidase